MKIDPKRVPKWNQNRCQDASEINARTGIEKDQENHEINVFLKGKIIEIHCKNKFV